MTTQLVAGDIIDVASVNQSLTYNIVYVGFAPEAGCSYIWLDTPQKPSNDLCAEVLNEYIKTINGVPVTWTSSGNGYVYASNGQATFNDTVNGSDLYFIISQYGRQTRRFYEADSAFKTAYPPVVGGTKLVLTPIAKGIAGMALPKGEASVVGTNAALTVRNALSNGMTVGSQLTGVTLVKQTACFAPPLPLTSGGTLDGASQYTSLYMANVPSLGITFLVAPLGTSLSAFCAFLNSDPQYHTINGTNGTWSPTGNGFIAFNGNYYCMPETLTAGDIGSYPKVVLHYPPTDETYPKNFNLTIAQGVSVTDLTPMKGVNIRWDLGRGYYKAFNHAKFPYSVVYSQDPKAIVDFFNKNYRDTAYGQAVWQIDATNYLSSQYGTVFNQTLQVVTQTDIADAQNSGYEVIVIPGSAFALNSAYQGGQGDGEDLPNGILYRNVGLAYGVQVSRNPNGNLAVAEGVVIDTVTHVMHAEIDGLTGVVLRSGMVDYTDTDIQTAIAAAVSPVTPTVAVDDVVNVNCGSVVNFSPAANDSGDSLSVVKFRVIDQGDVSDEWVSVDTVKQTPYGYFRLYPNGSLLVSAVSSASAVLPMGSVVQYDVEYEVSGEGGTDTGIIAVAFHGTYDQQDDGGGDGGNDGGDTTPGVMLPELVMTDTPSGWFLLRALRGTSMQSAVLAPTNVDLPAGSIVVNSPGGYVPLSESVEITQNSELGILYGTLRATPEASKCTLVVDFSEVSAKVLPVQHRDAVQSNLSRKTVIFRS